MVWSSPTLASLPTVREWLVCRQCGRDNSRPVPWRFRLREFRRRWLREARVYGWVGMWRRRDPSLTISAMWLLRREVLERRRRAKIAQAGGVIPFVGPAAGDAEGVGHTTGDRSLP